MEMHSGLPQKHPAVDLRQQYRLTVQISFVLSLLLVLFAFRVPFMPDTELEIVLVEQEVVALEEIEQTRQQEPPPPPPRVLVPIPVANDILLESELIDFDSELDMDQPSVYVPPQPPPPPPPPMEETGRDEQEIFVVVEQMPEIIGGAARLYQLIQYPEIARRAGLEGMVVVQVVVETDGRPSNPEVVRSAGAALDEAAVEAVMKLTFKPGAQRGRPVRVRYALPVRFRLRDAGTVS